MRAFCPGHITGFFTIEDSDDELLKRGSRGVGFCVEAGATSNVSIINEEQTEIDIFIDGSEVDAGVTERAIEMLLPDGSWHVKVGLELKAPIGYGLGMSAAGTFAACLALAEELGLQDARNLALQATHKAEVEMKTGLGDAVAQNIGGLVYRTVSGLPPFGKAEKIAYQKEDVVICILGGYLSTPDIIDSGKERESICDVGFGCLAEFEKQPDFPAFLRLSKKFAIESGLMTPEMRAALDSVSNVGEGSMAMLGNSIFVFGDTNLIEERLKKHGRIIKTNISSEGARLLD